MHRWEGNYNIQFKEISWKGMDWTVLANDRDKWWVVATVVMKLQVP
jgi:hypothetical protein